MFFVDPHNLWQWPTNGTSPAGTRPGGVPDGLIREWLSKGIETPQHQPYLTAIAEESNNWPRAFWGSASSSKSFA